MKRSCSLGRNQPSQLYEAVYKSVDKDPAIKVALCSTTNRVGKGNGSSEASSMWDGDGPRVLPDRLRPSSSLQASGKLPGHCPSSVTVSFVDVTFPH